MRYPSGNALPCSLFLLKNLEIPGFDGIFSQYKLLYLPTAGQRIGGDELEVARNLLVADLPLAVGA